MTKEERAAYSAARRQVIKQQTALQKAGIKTRGDVRKTFPTLKEIDKAGKKSVKGLTTKAQKWVSAPSHQIPSAKKEPELLVKSVDTKAERRKAAHRQAQRAYRERVKAMTQNEKNLLKGAKRFGMKNINTKNIKALAEYMAYRKAMSADWKYPLGEAVMDEFNELMQKAKDSGQSPEKVVSDFKSYMSDRTAMMSEMQTMGGYSFNEVNAMVYQYLER